MDRPHARTTAPYPGSREQVISLVGDGLVEAKAAEHPPRALDVRHERAGRGPTSAGRRW
ncbi:hypothetical protein [Gandjariella thermophila]|uniref:hypothetical protein n=1 Tax=Gandjariella thermophila TaxID=1931992 RepID=UPI00129AEC47|nr:hypothetical protein [Gandjariella thermophila]